VYKYVMWLSVKRGKFLSTTASHFKYDKIQIRVCYFSKNSNQALRKFLSLRLIACTTTSAFCFSSYSLIFALAIASVRRVDFFFIGRVKLKAGSVERSVFYVWIGLHDHISYSVRDISFCLSNSLRKFIPRLYGNCLNIL